MYEVSTTLEFTTNQNLQDYKVIVFVRCEELDQLGMVCDFYEMREETLNVVSKMDNDIFEESTNQNAEIIAEFIFARIKTKLTKGNHWLHAVEVWESDESGARHETDD